MTTAAAHLSTRTTACALALISLLSAADALHAQRRPDAPIAGAPGVTLSELTTFRNTDVVANDILPYGDDFFVSTYFQQGGTSILNLGNDLVELRDLRLYRYNADLEATAEIAVGWPDEFRSHISLASLGDRLLWTFATPSGKRGFYDIRAEVLDDAGHPEGAHVLATISRKEYDTLLDFEAHAYDRSHYVRVYADRSEQRLLSSRDDEPVTLTTAVFGRDGTAVSLVAKRLDVSRDQLDIQDVAVDASGKAFVLARVFGNDKGRETRGGSDSKVFVYGLEPGAEAYTKTELRLDGQYIEGLAMVPGEDGSVAIAGVYTDRRSRRIRGTFSTDDPTSGRVLVPKPFTQEFLASLGERVTTRKRGELAVEGDYEFLDALRLTDGRLSVLLEDFRVTTRGGYTTAVGGFAQQRIVYEYGEGVILTFGTDGELEEGIVIPKYQRTEQGAANYFARMSLVEYLGRPAVIYNDNPKNFVRSVDKRTKPLGFNKALAVLGYRGDDGELERRPIFARKEADKVVLVPSSTERLVSGDVVFVALRFRAFGQNQLRFGRIRDGALAGPRRATRRGGAVRPVSRQ